MLIHVCLGGWMPLFVALSSSRLYAFWRFPHTPLSSVCASWYIVLHDPSCVFQVLKLHCSCSQCSSYHHHREADIRSKSSHSYAQYVPSLETISITSLSYFLCSLQESSAGRENMGVFVLVHGSWHGGWCWEKIVPVLQKNGHRVLAPDLPGHCNDKTPISKISLQSYVDCVCKILDSMPRKMFNRTSNS